MKLEGSSEENRGKHNGIMLRRLRLEYHRGTPLSGYRVHSWLLAHKLCLSTDLSLRKEYP